MTEDWKRHQPEKECRHRITFKHDSPTSKEIGKEGFPRHYTQKSTVFHLVYGFLNKVAERDMRWIQRNSACNRFRKQHARRKNIRKQALTRTSYGAGMGDVYMCPGQKELPETFCTHRSSSDECIADYARAVRDERRHGMFYVRDALLYGLQSGLLIPTNSQRTLRLSEKLGAFSMKDSVRYEMDQSSTSGNDI